MADITVTAASVAACDPEESDIFSYTASATITAGQAVYFVASTGKVAPADGSAASTANMAGIALQGAGAGQAVDVISRGRVTGFTLAGDYGSLVWLSDTDTGILADATGTTGRKVGRVVPLNDAGTLTKVLFVDIRHGDYAG